MTETESRPGIEPGTAVLQTTFLTRDPARGAVEENRTPIASMAHSHSTIELPPQAAAAPGAGGGDLGCWSGQRDSNPHRRLGRPRSYLWTMPARAARENCTRRLLCTRQVPRSPLNSRRTRDPPRRGDFGRTRWSRGVAAGFAAGPSGYEADNPRHPARPVERRGLEPRSLPCEGSVLPLNHHPDIADRFIGPRRPRGGSNSPHLIDNQAASPDAYEGTSLLARRAPHSASNTLRSASCAASRPQFFILSPLPSTATSLTTLIRFCSLLLRHFSLRLFAPLTGLEPATSSWKGITVVRRPASGKGWRRCWCSIHLSYSGKRRGVRESNPLAGVLEAPRSP